MQKIIMMCLMICSLAYSNEVEIVKKQLSDSTTIIKLTIPKDPNVYTCLDSKTYRGVIGQLGDAKFITEQYDICKSNLVAYNNIDSLYAYNLKESKALTKEIKEFNDKTFEKLEKERKKKWYVVLAAFAAGTLAGTLIGSISINISK